MTSTNLPHPTEASQQQNEYLDSSVHPQKFALVTQGLLALSNGDWATVAAVSRLIEKVGWAHV